MDDNLSEISNDLYQENKKNFPILVPSGKENYNEKEIEETKENKRVKKNAKNANSNFKRKKKMILLIQKMAFKKQQIGI